MDKGFRQKNCHRINVFILLAIVVAFFSADSSAQVFWVNITSDTVCRADIDGSNQDESLVTVPSTPIGVAADANFVYWCDYSLDTVGRAGTDGSSPNNSWITGCDAPTGVAVDANYVYWGNQSGDTIGRANLNGTSANQNWITGADGASGVAVDSNYVYYALFKNGTGTTIGRANLDGTGANHGWITGCDGPTDVAVDDSYVYWSNYDFLSIGRANLDGSVVNQNWITGLSGGPWGVDVSADYIYWAADGDVGIANIDGSDPLNTWLDDYGTQRGLALGTTSTPVTLVFFTAKQLNDHVKVEWATAMEEDTAGFHIWRACAQNKDFVRVSVEMIPASGGPFEGVLYRWLDNTATAGTTYWYKLEDVSFGGLSTWHGPVKATGKKPGTPRQ